MPAWSPPRRGWSTGRGRARSPVPSRPGPAPAPTEVREAEPDFETPAPISTGEGRTRVVFKPRPPGLAGPARVEDDSWHPEPKPAPGRLGRDELAARLIEIVRERTGYPAE